MTSELTTSLSRLEPLSNAELARKRRDKTQSFACYYEAVLTALTPNVVEALEGYVVKLPEGAVEIPLYGRLFHTVDREALWNTGAGGVNGDKSWAGAAGEQLVILVGKDQERKFLHRLQEGKHEDLARDYNPRYESPDEPTNYNSHWLWPFSEYERQVVPTAEFFEQRRRVSGGFPERLPADPTLTLYVRVLAPEDVAKHSVFAEGAKKHLERICESAYKSRDSLVRNAERTIQENEAAGQRILAAVAGK